MTIQSLFEVFFQYNVMNQLWYFLLEIINAVLLEAFFGLFVLLKQTSTFLIVNNVIVFILLMSYIVIFVIQNYSLSALIINIFYCLSMASGYIFFIILFNTNLKSQKNVMQNIEEIINFTEIAEDIKDNDNNNDKIK